MGPISALTSDLGPRCRLDGYAMLPRMLSPYQPLSSDSAQENFIDVTPRPIFTRLKRSNDGMRGRVKMFRGVAIRRRVTATHMSARQAKSQMDPGRTDLQTFLTPVRTGNDVMINLIEVCAFCEAHNMMVFAM
jgi:hypothetical protein